MSKNGILLINLGTPDHCDSTSVSRYLTEFLNDPRVIDLPSLLRWMLVNLIIVPFRKKRSAKAYQKIWLDSGSPLLVHSLELKQVLATALGDNYQVELGMRYGNPSIQSALDKLDHCDNLLVIPLFPQYSSAATGSTIEECLRSVSKRWNLPQLRVIKDFYNNPGFISAYADIINNSVRDKPVEMLLFSYHGLPERDINHGYRTQCVVTSELLAKKLGLEPNQYKVSFQSRLGYSPWIKPYTDFVLPELVKQGIKNIAIVCPSFVVDCLETLEEVNIRTREQWHKLGGNELICIPCLNSHTTWVEALATIAKNH